MGDKKGVYDESEAKENIDAIFAPVKKAVNTRKKKGKSNKVTQQLILAALHKKGFIVVDEDGDYIVNLTTEIEAVWGDEGESNSTTEDIREILERVVTGLKSQNKPVTVRRLLKVDD